MKVLLAVAVVAAATALTIAVAGAGAHGGGRTIHVVEHATTDAVSNPGVGGAADNVGDVLTFANDVFDSSDAKVVGHDQGYCVRIVVGDAWECAWTTLLAGGQITVAGPFYDTRDSRLAITGGTGRYADASGWMELRAREGGTKFDFVFHLSH